MINSSIVSGSRPVTTTTAAAHSPVRRPAPITTSVLRATDLASPTRLSPRRIAGGGYAAAGSPRKLAGSMSLSGTTSLSGTATLSGTSTVSGSQTFAGTGTLAGTTTIATSTVQPMPSTMQGAATLSGTQTLAGTASIAGTQTLTVLSPRSLSPASPSGRRNRNAPRSRSASPDRSAIFAGEEEDLDPGASHTARWTAALRALENERPDALFKDPQAEIFAGVNSSGMWRERTQEDRVTQPDARSHIAIRARALDDLVAESIKGLNAPAVQVLNLGAGMCTRAWRLDIPGVAMTWYDVDNVDSALLKANLARKTTEPPRVEKYYNIGIDFSLPNACLTTHLQLKGYDPSQPTCVVMEGFIYYLDYEPIEAMIAELREFALRNNKMCIVGSCINDAFLAELKNPNEAVMKQYPGTADVGDMIHSSWEGGIRAIFEAHGFFSTFVQSREDYATFLGVEMLWSPFPNRLTSTEYINVLQWSNNTGNNSDSKTEPIQGVDIGCESWNAAYMRLQEERSPCKTKVLDADSTPPNVKTLRQVLQAESAPKTFPARALEAESTPTTVIVKVLNDESMPTSITGSVFLSAPSGDVPSNSSPQRAALRTTTSATVVSQAQPLTTVFQSFEGAVSTTTVSAAAAAAVPTSPTRVYPSAASGLSPTRSRGTAAAETITYVASNSPMKQAASNSPMKQAIKFRADSEAASPQKTSPVTTAFAPQPTTYRSGPVTTAISGVLEPLPTTYNTRPVTTATSGPVTTATVGSVAAAKRGPITTATVGSPVKSSTVGSQIKPPITTSTSKAVVTPTSRALGTVL